MKLSIDHDLQREAEDFSDALITAMQSTDLPPAGWRTVNIASAVPGDTSFEPGALAAFTIAGKYLQSQDFGKDLLEEWRDERADGKQHDSSYSMADFMEDLGYLENFTGRNLTQLVKYYLSPAAIEDAGWDHMATVESADGKYTAYLFCPISFREHDGIMWYQENATGRGIAIPHDEL